VSQNKTVLIHTSVQGLFLPLISSAEKDLNFSLAHESKAYLLSVLEASLLTDSVFAKDTNTGFYNEPMISEQFLKALQEECRSEKCAQLKKLGDSILFKAGFFSESLKRKLSGLSFHIQMGSSIYSSLYSSSENPVFEDISNRFSGYVDLVSNIGRRVNLRKERDVFNLFDRFVQADSEEAKSKLLQLGLRPDDVKKASNQ